MHSQPFKKHHGAEGSLSRGCQLIESGLSGVLRLMPEGNRFILIMEGHGEKD